jgi:hypothetical protein
MSDQEVLKKIGSIDIPGLYKLDVARNGQFYLVKSCGNDAYGNQIYEALDPDKNGGLFPPDKMFINSLIQIIGGLILDRDALASQLASAVRTKAD